MKVGTEYLTKQTDKLEDILAVEPSVENQLLMIIALETLANRALLSSILETLEADE